KRSNDVVVAPVPISFLFALRVKSVGTLGALPDWSERGADLGREQLRLFPGGEVTALVHLVEVGDVGVGLLDPAARGPPDLAGERGEADRDRDRRGGLAGSLFLSFLPVRAGRRGTRAGQPVQPDLVAHVVPR